MPEIPYMYLLCQATLKIPHVKVYPAMYQDRFGDGFIGFGSGQFHGDGYATAKNNQYGFHKFYRYEQ